MHITRIYIDTSVIGGCFDEEFAEWSNRLFDDFTTGMKIAVISNIIQIQNNPEVDELANKYIEFKAISPKYYNDALHIALATVYGIDLLVSWNFKHIVNYNRIILYNSINQMNGYKSIEIRTPKEVVNYEEEI